MKFRILQSFHGDSTMSPLTVWAEGTQKLFEMSEIAGKYIDVLTIPQVHKLLNVR